jgi:hypothetical protein
MASPRTVERPAIRDLYEGRARPYRERVAPYRRERREFGGHIQWEAVFFGLLAAIGLVASLIAMVLGGLVAAGVADFTEDAASLVDRMATGGGAVGVAILALGYMAGGYVAARMARFDGWRQGLGVWLLSVLLILAAAITAWIAGGELDPAESITLPSNPIDEGPLHNSDVALAAVAVLVPLIFALIGGVLGERFHRAVDRVGFEPEPAADEERDFEPEPDEDSDLDDEERTAEQEQETKPVP